MKSKLFIVFFTLMYICHLNSLENNGPNAVPIQSQVNQFLQGHKEFRKLNFPLHENEFVRMTKEGQNPKILFIGCSDSRVVPDLILNTKPGDLFVIRTAGNFVPPYVATELADSVTGTLQFAIESLGIKEIIVCGHSHCGAIAGLFDPSLEEKLPLVNQILRFGQEAKKAVLQNGGDKMSVEERNVFTEQISILFQIEHLLSFPFIKERVEKQELFLHGWYYQIETGRIWAYDSNKQQFFAL